MASLLGILCRAWRCGPCGPGGREHPEQATPTRKNDGSPDDLTAIQGIGIATQNRLHVSGIKSYVQLAEASPEHLRTILGKRASGARVEDWIADAGKLAEEAASDPA